MLKFIIKKEIEENIKSFRFLFLISLCFILISFSNYEMYNQYVKNIEDYSFKTPQKNEILIKKLPSFLSIYVNGTQELTERTFLFAQDMYEPMELSLGINLNIFRQLFPTLDFLYISKIILSLLSLIMSFDLICGEKNNGTLRLVLSNPIHKKTFLLGKIIANYLLIIIPVIIIFIFNLILISLSSKVNITGNDFLRLFIILGLCLIYLVGFFCLGVLISSLSKSPQSSIISCFIVWIFLIVVIPSGSSLIAKNFSNLPNERMFEEKKQWMIKQAEKNQNNIESSKTNELFTKLNQYRNDYRNNLLAYIKISKNLNRISPAGDFSILITNMAGYGLEDEFKLRYSITEFTKIIQNNIGKQQFNYNQFTLSKSFTNSIIDCIILILFVLISFYSAYIAFQKYDVR